ncbi:MAG: hypothetical protein LUD72_11250 [Bacteroidales bacterium]|nr:hypothetical protein [Bacteroidales bacterium]
MSRAIIIVNSCADCPYYSRVWRNGTSDGYLCNHSNRQMDEAPEEIPGWCDLVRAIGYVEEVGNMVSWDYAPSPEAVLPRIEAVQDDGGLNIYDDTATIRIDKDGIWYKLNGEEQFRRLTPKIPENE